VMYRLGDSYLMSERYEEAVKVFQTLNAQTLKGILTLTTEEKMYV